MEELHRKPTVHHEMGACIRRFVALSNSDALTTPLECTEGLWPARLHAVEVSEPLSNRLVLPAELWMWMGTADKDEDRERNSMCSVPQKEPDYAVVRWLVLSQCLRVRRTRRA